MKIHISLLFCLLALLASCSNDESSVPATPDGYAHLSFSIMNHQLVSMDDEESRAATAATGLDHLEMAVYDAEGQLVQSQKQAKGDKNYSTFDALLPYGSYTVVFLGFNGSHASDLSTPTAITFEDNYVPNCYCYSTDVTVDASTSGTTQIVMKRCVGCFRLVCNDGLPSNMTAMNYTSEGGGTALNALTGLAASTTTRTGSFSIAPGEDRSKGIYSVYAFLPSETCTMQFTMTAVSANGSTIRERVFSDVEMRLNYRNEFSGDFFTAEASDWNGKFNLTLAESEWTDVKNTY